MYQCCPESVLPGIPRSQSRARRLPDRGWTGYHHWYGGYEWISRQHGHRVSRSIETSQHWKNVAKMCNSRHLTDLPLEKVLVPTLKHWYVYQLVYPLSVGMVKFSILAQYYRIFAVKKFRMATLGVGLFVFAYTIICVFVNVSLPNLVELDSL